MTLLKNDHIILRAPEPEDLDSFYAWENDTELWEYGATLSPYSRYAIKEYLAALTHNIYESNQLRFMVEHRASGKVAGMIDLYDFDPHHRRAGVGVLVDKSFRRRQVASQALHLLTEYAFSFLHIHQLFAHIPTANTHSMALFEKNGFTHSGTLKEWLYTPDGYKDIYVMQKIGG